VPVAGTVEYATGIAREFVPPSDPTCILTTPARIDHAWVVFQTALGDEEWQIWTVLAVVELKRGKRVGGLSKNGAGNEASSVPCTAGETPIPKV
jgi:hypothetical protein